MNQPDKEFVSLVTLVLYIGIFIWTGAAILAGACGWAVGTLIAMALGLTL